MKNDDDLKMLVQIMLVIFCILFPLLIAPLFNAQQILGLILLCLLWFGIAINKKLTLLVNKK